ncbi:hypothetical protein BS47DRAFT_1394035 [Hydnum rufescens UP504]|uniref:Uncharacterized protein n=1 Tax=Hydnum rufescens UP504 TaxID=1448309 RepID=A0A9P6DWB5_9AGAM|nr:hypothetical protein BS47DRAFT_1394035 [Hydnum rufescens UP504]
MSYDNLMKMKEHPWFEHQLNMCALKACIIAKACQKNVEMDNLTGAFRSKAIDVLDRLDAPDAQNTLSKPPLDPMIVLAEHAGVQQQTRPPLDVLHIPDAEEHVDSSDDGEDFELEPTPIPRDSALIAAMDLVDKNCSSDGGNEVDSSDEEESPNEL